MPNFTVRADLGNGKTPYYRLTSPAEHKRFTAWEHVSPDRREALVSLVAGGTYPAPPFCTLRLKGLDPAIQYRVNESGALYSGEALMQAGYPLPLLHGDYQSLQIYLQAK